MEKHDHPTGAGSGSAISRPGLGAAATLTFADAEAIRKMAGVQYVAGGIHENAARALGRTRRRSAGSPACTAPTCMMLDDQARVDVHAAGGSSPRANRSAPGRWWCSARSWPTSCSARASNPVGQEVTLWNQPFEVVGVVTSATLGRAAGAGRRSVRRGLHAVHDDAPAAQPVEAERHHGDRGIDRATCRGCRSEITELLRQRHGIGDRRRRTTSRSRRRPPARSTTGGLPPSVARGRRRQRRGARAGHARAARR